jgi:hypothetical protein
MTVARALTLAVRRLPSPPDSLSLSRQQERDATARSARGARVAAGCGEAGGSMDGRRGWR